MAYTSDKKPLELSALTSLATDDTIIVGDTSDTSEVVKAITKANFLTDLGGTFLQDSDIGTSVQAYSSVLQNTTASFTSADETKLDGIEALADVTDAANVDAAGAVMNSDTSTASMSFVIDEDDMSTNSATKVPTQQSVKAYVDAQTGGGGVTEALAIAYAVSL